MQWRSSDINASDIQVFSRVAQTANFSEAAEQLGLTRSAISKCVSRLESRLGVVLINRSTRTSSLTDAGRRFYEYAKQIDESVEKAIAAVSGGDQDVVGNLTVSLPTSLGAALTPLLVDDFSRKWPRLTLNLQFNDRQLDLIGRSIDAAIWLSKRLNDSNLLSKRLGTTRSILAASPGYLAKYGTPKTIDDLKDHRCLDLGRPGQSRVVWRLHSAEGLVETPVECVLNSNTDLPLILAACMGEGILFTQEILVGCELRKGRLQVVLPNYPQPMDWGVYGVYPNHGPPAKVRAFIDFVEQHLQDLETIDRWSHFDRLDDKARKVRT